MTLILEFLRSGIASDISIALMHTLWQAVVISAILYIILKVLPASQKYWRYRLSVISLFFLLLCWLATFSILQYEPQIEDISPKANIATNKVSTSFTNHIPPVDPDTAPIDHSATVGNTSVEPSRIGVGYLCIFWFLGVLVMLIRLFRSLATTSTLKRESVDINDGSARELFEKLCKQMNITQKIRFASTEVLKQPGVIGFFRPVLLIPVSMLAGLPTDYLEAVIAHELAHIRRYDYLVNLFQMLIEAIFFFNPAVWWISRQVRLEREACCDDAGIKVTGKRIQYARVLFEILSRTTESTRPATTAAITGFSNESSSSSAERVKRIINPHHKPQMRIGWVKLAFLVAISSIAMLGLWKTADATVNIAAKILTPSERIEKMEELEKSYGQPEYNPDHREPTEDEKVTIAGTIKTWDGKKVGRLAHMCIRYSRHQSSGTIGISPSYNSGSLDGSTGKFSHRCSYGTIYVTVSSMRYAPAVAGPFNLQPGEKKEDIELSLEKGSPAIIQVIDAESKNPVNNVELVGGYLLTPGGYGHTIKLKTNDKGTTVIEHAGDFNVTLKARATGYQTETFEDQGLIKNGTVVLKMKKAVPAEGIVVSKKTGETVANAQIRVQQSIGKSASSWGRDQGEIVGTTDDEGRFIIDRLSQNKKYVLSIKAENYAYAFTDKIQSGVKNIRIELDEPIIIKGRVTGPLDMLSEKDGKPYVLYSCSFRWEDHSHGETSQYAFVDIKGDKGTFELTNLWGTSVNVGSKHWRKHIKFDDRIPDKIVLDLSVPVADDGIKYHKRKLVLDFVTPEGTPPPTGNIRLNYMDPAFSSTTYKAKLLEIVDGKAQTEIVVPGKINYRIADTIGYWFKGAYVENLEPGDSPLTIKVPVIPAGMIFGQVSEADGSPAGNIIVSYHVVKDSQLLGENAGSLDVEGKNSSSSTETETKYTINPLPLGGEYKVIAHRRSTYIISDSIKLTEGNPIQEIDLKLPEGVTISGRVLLPDGSPARNINYNLDFDAATGKGFSNQGYFSDSQGRFEIKHVNPDTGGAYLLKIKSDKDYRPVKMKLADLAKPIEIKLEKGAVATGLIIDKETGWPIPSVEIAAYYHNYRDGNSEHEQVEAEAKTDKDGRFRFSNLKQGRIYNLVVRSCRDDMEKIIGGETKDKIIKVTPSKLSDLKPRKPDIDN